MKKETIFIGVVALVLFFGWSLYDNQEYFRAFDINKADASDATATLSATVAAGSVTLAISSGATVNFGTITPGQPRYSATGFNVSANDTINVYFGRDRSSPATTLASSANTTINITDVGTGTADAFTGCTTPVTAVWAAGSSTGLAYSLFIADEAKDTTCWGAGTSKTHASNKYAALQASSGANAAWTTTSTGSTIKASVGWVLDTSAVQQATSYTGDVVITATVTTP